MSNNKLLVIGVAILLPLTARAASIYEQMREFTYMETLNGESAENTVKTFIRRIYPDKSMQVQNQDIDRAIHSKLSELCDKRDGRDNLTDGECKRLQSDLLSLTGETEWIRALGRDLQAIATTYEVPIDGYPQRKINIASRMPSIIKIWQSPNDRMVSPVQEIQLRGGQYTDEMDSLFGELQSAIQDVKNSSNGTEKFTAAIWRYRNGHTQLIQKEGACSDEMEEGDGTELQYLSARWCGIEEALGNLLNALPVPDPPLTQNDHVIYYAYKYESLNVAFWANQRDTGLQWEIGFEPVLPSLDCTDATDEPYECDPTGAILGGIYPSLPVEPGEKEGLCSHFFAQQGYMCRPYEQQQCRIEREPPPEEGEEEEEDNGGRYYNIELTSCAPQAFSSYTRAELDGPNICQWGGWRKTTPTLDDAEIIEDTAEKQDDGDERIVADECSNCAIDLYCASSCEFPDGSGETSDYAITYPKNEDGVIQICLPNSMGPKGYLKHLILHELIHAQQECNLGGSLLGRITDSASCCAVERKAYFAQCAAMEEDGILGMLGITAEMCGSALANNSCIGFGTPEDPEDPDSLITPPCTDPFLNAEEVKEINDRIWPYLETHVDEFDLPTSCEEAVNNLDPRSQAIKDSLPLVCSPECQAKYENTIGNNLCYLGQCIEQSIESQRILPGRYGIQAVEQAFPRDNYAPFIEDAGGAISVPRPTFTRFPRYRPRLLVEQMDVALCQINGMPSLTPPSLCGFSSLRRFTRPLYLYTDIAQDISDQRGDVVESTYALQNMTESIASRVGTQLYIDYLENAGKTLVDVVRIANGLLKSIEDISFPSQMCPRSY